MADGQTVVNVLPVIGHFSLSLTTKLTTIPVYPPGPSGYLTNKMTTGQIVSIFQHGPAPFGQLTIEVCS